MAELRTLRRAAGPGRHFLLAELEAALAEARRDGATGGATVRCFESGYGIGVEVCWYGERP